MNVALFFNRIICMKLPAKFRKRIVNYFTRKEYVIYQKDKEKSNKIFYIIRNKYDNVGLMSYHNVIYYHLNRALQMKAIPIVDMQYYPNTYLAPNLIGEKNSWDYFFEQVKDENGKPYKLEEIYKKENYILCSNNYPIDYGDLGREQELDKAQSIVKQYMCIHKEFEETVNNKKQKMWPENQKVLGVLCRGTDYVKLKPKFHSIPPTACEAIEETKRKMSEWGYDYVYLATEDASILSAFEETFGDKLLFLDCRRYDEYSDGYLGDVHFDRSNDEYLKMEEYLMTICLLSMCDSLLLTSCAGSLAALRMNNKHEHIALFDKGMYKD